MKQGLNDCKPCTVKHETITEENRKLNITLYSLRPSLSKENE